MAMVLTSYDGSDAGLLASAITGTGITILSAEYTGDPTQAAFFSGAEMLGLTSGVLLTSGDAQIPDTNTQSGFTGITFFGGPGDADLTAVLNAASATPLAGNVTHDAAFITIDFKAAAGASAIRFDLVFGSEEFPEWTNNYVDIAGVFVDGVNYAYFGGPNTPLSVLQGNVDAGYFIDNDTSNVLPIEYDGVSNLLTIVAPLNAGLTNHTIKIAIADTGDSALDSGLFISGLTTDTASGGGVKQVVEGTAGSDTMLGTAAAEYFKLGASGDKCTAGGGDDVTLGAGGNDTMFGGGGEDQLDGGNGNDIMDGGSGEDTVSYGSATKAVTVNLGMTALQNTGGAGSDKLTNLENLLGGAYADKLTGSGGANLINGGAGSDKISGGNGSDILIGSAGNDVLNGGAGHDTLIGGLGADSFRFTGTPVNANSDVISDFRTAQGDHIDVDFAGLGPLGALNAALFAHGAGMVAAPSAGVLLFYDDTAGKLYYDADGSGGASTAVLVAKLTGHPALQASDIHVI